jgi:hypothetical protein
VDAGVEGGGRSGRGLGLETPTRELRRRLFRRDTIASEHSNNHITLAEGRRDVT